LKCKAYIVIVTLLVVMAAGKAVAQPLPVQEVPSGGEGKEFTLKIPVRFKDVVAVDFVWYRDNVAVTAVTRLTDSETLPDGRTLGKISYTIPDSAAYGEAEYRFEYRVDRCDWLPGAYTYAVKFLPWCAKNSEGSIEAEDDDAPGYNCALNGVGEIGIEEEAAEIVCELNDAGSVEVEEEVPPNFCTMNGAGRIEVEDE